MYKILACNNLEGLTRLKADWKAITDSCIDAPFYQMYEWYHAYLGCLEPDPQDVYFFLVKKDQEPVSIFPLKRQSLNWHGFRMRLWVTPRTDEIALCDFIAKDKATIVSEFQSVMEYLNSIKDYCFDGIFLRRILEGDNAWMLVDDKFIRRKIITHHSHSKYLKCTSDGGKPAPGGTSKFKRNLRRLEKRLRSRGQVTFELDVADHNQKDAFLSFMDVEASGWKGEDGTKTAVKYTDRAIAFYSELIETFGALGRCRINLLKLNGTVIAAQYCLFDKRRINLQKIGYDQSHSDCSPGYLLIRNLFEEGCNSGEFDELSFVTGAGWNDVFHPRKKNVFIVHILNLTYKGWIYFVFTSIRNALKKILRRND
jgi:hypothetical protein